MPAMSGACSASLRRELAAEGELQERTERVVHAVEGILGAEPLASRQTGELGALLANDAVERVEDVFPVSGAVITEECAETDGSYAL